MTDHKKNIYGQTLQQCHSCHLMKDEASCTNECVWRNNECILDPGDRGSRQSDGTCSENVGGMHQICARFDQRSGEVFSDRTLQSSGWSKERTNKSHCLCLGAYSHYVSNPHKHPESAPDLALMCHAIPETALQNEYLEHWTKWNQDYLTEQANMSLGELITTCYSQGDDAQKEGLQQLVCSNDQLKNLSKEIQCSDASISARTGGEEKLRPGGLRQRYSQIFKTNNRNVGGHLWAKHIIDRSQDLTHHEFEDLFKEYCPISGSPVGVGRTPFLYSGSLALDSSEGQDLHVSHCCWPCVCDLKDGAEVVVKEYKTRDGQRDYNMLAMKINPCKGRPDGPMDGDLRHQAPELYCENQRLRGADTVSESDLRPIIGMARVPQDGETAERVSHDRCTERAEDGYRSGMGTLFRQASGL